MNTAAGNTDQQELDRFDRVAARWWDPQGEMRPLHALNPVRADFIERRAGGLKARRALDVGCGGGLLTEALAERGAKAEGIDAAAGPLRVARLHAEESGAQVSYEQATAEAWAAEHPDSYEVVCCLEMLEHVPDPGAVVRACAAMVKPGGHVFFSTINRTPRAFATAILGAEYLAGLLPRGTHSYDKLIRPSELAGWMREAGLQARVFRGLWYNPLTESAGLSSRPSVNYIVHARRPEESE